VGFIKESSAAEQWWFVSDPFQQGRSEQEFIMINSTSTSSAQSVSWWSVSWW
jgi:hypothetical protein